MNAIKSKPYFLFLGVIVILLLVGFLLPTENSVINIHDTYLVISKRDLVIILSLPYVLFALIYFTLLKFNFRLINWITVFHVTISILGLCLLLILTNSIREVDLSNYKNLMNDIQFNERIGYGIWAVIFTIIAAQILFLVNIVFGLTKGRNPIKTQLKL